MKCKNVIVKIQVIVILLILVLVCISCKKDKEDNQKQEVMKITVWNYYNGALSQTFNDYVEKFNSTIGKEKNIKVTAVSKGNIGDLTSELLIAINTSTENKETPDLFMCYRDMMMDILKANSDKVVDYNEYFSEDELVQYYDDYLEEGYFGDKLYILPFAKSTDLLLVNQNEEFENFLTDEGLVASECFDTWENLLLTAKLYYDWTDGKTPDVLNDGKPLFGLDSFVNFFISTFNQLGNPIYTYGEDGKVTFDIDDDILKVIFDNYYIPYTNGYIDAQLKYRSDDVKQGLMPAYIGSMSSVSFFPSEAIDIFGNVVSTNMVAYLAPCLEGSEKSAIQQGAGMALMSSDKEKEKAAVEFIKWLTSEEINLAVASELSYLSVNENVKDTKSIENNDKLDENMITVLDIGILQSAQYKMVRGFDFENSYSIRTSLTNSMETMCKDGREEFLSYKNISGFTFETAYSKMDYEEKFKIWKEEVKELFK